MNLLNNKNIGFESLTILPIHNLIKTLFFLLVIAAGLVVCAQISFAQDAEAPAKSSSGGGLDPTKKKLFFRS